MELEKEHIPLDESVGRILSEPVLADRNFPPYDRATMDGIAIAFKTFKAGERAFRIAGMARAGVPQQVLPDPTDCLEIATGAVLPKGTDTVIRYEDLERSGESFQILSEVRPGQNIHRKGSDAGMGDVLLDAGTRIGPAEVSVMASVGCHTPETIRLPQVTLVSSGDELVDIDQSPEPHQIRKSNIHTLKSELKRIGIHAKSLHLADDPDHIRSALTTVLAGSDVLMLSGGVSKGRYDFIPEALLELGVKKIFHRVAQRPGKPFWFGQHPERRCWVFSFPGNPVSTFLNYHLYFREWLGTSQGHPRRPIQAVLAGDLSNPSDLTHFIPVALHLEQGVLLATAIPMNGSGDFISLTRADGFIRLDPKSNVKEGTYQHLIPYNPIWR